VKLSTVSRYSNKTGGQLFTCIALFGETGKIANTGDEVFRTLIHQSRSGRCGAIQPLIGVIGVLQASNRAEVGVLAKRIGALWRRLFLRSSL
jgi:hypothetical protein